MHIPSKYNHQNNLNKFHIYKKPKKKSLPIGSSIQCKLWLFQKKIKKKKKTILYQYIYIYSSCHSLLKKKKKNLNSKKRILHTAEPCFNHCSSLVAILSNPDDISAATWTLSIQTSVVGNGISLYLSLSFFFWKPISPSLIVQCACTFVVYFIFAVLNWWFLSDKVTSVKC